MEAEEGYVAYRAWRRGPPRYVERGKRLFAPACYVLSLGTIAAVAGDVLFDAAPWMRRRGDVALFLLSLVPYLYSKGEGDRFPALPVRESRSPLLAVIMIAQVVAAIYVLAHP